MLRARLPSFAALSLTLVTGCGSSSSSGDASSNAGAGASGGGSGGSATGTGGGAGRGGTGGNAGVAGAGGSAGAAGTSSTTLADGLPASCSPLRHEGACLMPFPNAIYTTEDATSKTGRRVAFSKETLPQETQTGTRLDPTRYNMADGFSPATPILTWFPERIDRASLPPLHDPSASLSPSSATVLVDMTTNQLVAHFAEVDVSGKSTARQALVLRPTTRLQTSHQYAVGITSAIKTVDGSTPASPPQFAAIVAGQPPADELSAKQAARMPAVLSALGAAGVDTKGLVLAWDFVTGSDEQITGHVLSMRDTALTAAGDDGIGLQITSVKAPPEPTHVLRRIDGTVKVPLFLSSGNVKVKDAQFSFDAAGLPVSSGTNYDVAFAAIVPKKAMTSKVTLMLFGHGILGSGPDYLDDSRLQQIADDYGYLMVATDWIGLSKYENPLNMDGNGAAGDALTNFDHLPWITDRLQQSLVNNIVLLRTARGLLAKDPVLTVSGTGGDSVLDGKPPVYFGISLGGIMGGSFMGYTPDVERGALNVAGSTWSLMFQRSANWSIFSLLVNGSYPDALDQQVLIALAQMQFDYSDPINAAPHLLSNPMPGNPPKKILQQMSVNDAEVPNIASEILARTMGLSLLDDSPIDIYGMTKVTGPVDSALGVFDTKPSQIPPDTDKYIPDNGAHAGCIETVAAQKQVDEFLRNADVKSFCDGVCDPQ